MAPHIRFAEFKTLSQSVESYGKVEGTGFEVDDPVHIEGPNDRKWNGKITREDSNGNNAAVTYGSVEVKDKLTTADITITVTHDGEVSNEYGSTALLVE